MTEVIEAYDFDDGLVQDDSNDDGCETDKDEVCFHKNISNIDGSSICDECGLKIDESLLYNENIYYGVDDTRYNKNPSRHHKRKDEERSLYSDLEPLEFPQFIIEKANDYYKTIIKDKIYRAKNRLSIVFACTFYAYIDCEEPQSANELAKKFNLNKKGISSGLKSFANIFRNRPNKKHIQPLDLIPKLLSDLGISDPTFYEDIKKIYDFVEARSPTIKTSIPQSVAAGLVYYYLKLKKYPISRAEFAKIVRLTEITFTKIANDTSEIIGKKVKC